MGFAKAKFRLIGDRSSMEGLAFIDRGDCLPNDDDCRHKTCLSEYTE